MAECKLMLNNPAQSFLLYLWNKKRDKVEQYIYLGQVVSAASDNERNLSQNTHQQEYLQQTLSNYEK